MVEINNQRKAFLDMLAWSEGTDNGRQKTRNHGYDVIVGGELFTDYPDHPRKLVTLNPKPSNQQAPDATSFFPLVGCLPQEAILKDFSPKSQDAVALQQIKERGALPMIDRGDIRQQLTVAAISGLHCRALVMVSSSIRLDSLIAKFKEAGGTVREIDVREQSHRDYSALVICIIVCLSWAVNHYRDNAITYKAQRDKKCQRTEAGERGNY